MESTTTVSESKLTHFIKTYAPLLVFLAAMLWATDAPFRVHLTKDLSSNFIVMIEHFVNLIFVIPLLFMNWKELKLLKGREWLAVVAIGVGGSALASIAFTQSFHYVNPSVAIVLQKLQPFIAIGLAATLLKEKMPKRFWLWALIAILGAYVISFPHFTPQMYQGETWNPNILGVLCALAAALLWGASTVFGKYVLNKVSFKAMTGLRFATGFLFLFVLNLSTGSFSQIKIATSKDWLFLVIVSLVSGALSLLVYYRGLQFTKASIATLAELGFVFASLVINAIFLDAHLVWMQFVGIGILLFAVLKLAAVNREVSLPETNQTATVS